MDNTVFVLVTDNNYFWKALVTINDLRSIGNWEGDLVLVTIDFNLDESYKNNLDIIEAKFPIINKTHLLNEIGPNGFSNSDKREINKLNQWEKLHVFDDYFLKWDRVVFLDAGLRVLDNVKYLLELDYRNKILAPVDGKQLTKDPNAIFKYQIDHENNEKVELVKKDFGENIFDKTYMLNCMWIYDTSILKICNKKHLIEAMNKYTLCRTNEMALMNLMFHFKYNLWEKFPPLSSNDKYLFEWCELNNNFVTSWRNYCFMKYPISINLYERPIL
jgi:lipopolysaccharide biosynthesis glycosyltransferase